jgi:hypothetical protein
VSVIPYPSVAGDEETKPLLSACLFPVLVMRSFSKVVGNKFRHHCWSENEKGNVTMLERYFGVKDNFSLSQHFFLSRGATAPPHSGLISPV